MSDTTCTVLLFAQAADLAGEARVDVEIGAGQPASAVMSSVIERHAALAPLRDRVALAVNERYVTADHVVMPGDVVALIPPVSGG